MEVDYDKLILLDQLVKCLNRLGFLERSTFKKKREKRGKKNWEKRGEKKRFIYTDILVKALCISL
jgi:hypothetical protein